MKLAILATTIKETIGFFKKSKITTIALVISMYLAVTVQCKATDEEYESFEECQKSQIEIIKELGDLL